MKIEIYCIMLLLLLSADDIFHSYHVNWVSP